MEKGQEEKATTTTTTTANGGVGSGEAVGKDGSICGYESLHSLLSANLSPPVFQVIEYRSPVLD